MSSDKVECDRCGRKFSQNTGLANHIQYVHESGDKPWTNEETLRRMYHDEGMRQKEIADTLGCGLKTVSRWMNRLNIDTERTKRAGETRRQRRATFTHSRGYEKLLVNVDGDRKGVLVHRPVAVAEWGVDAVIGNHVHHRDHIPWDNRPDNLELLTPSEHASHHASGGDPDV